MKLTPAFAAALGLVAFAPANAADTYLRAPCGRYTGGMPAMTAAKGIVTRMWERNGESCSYANNGFRRDAERAINNEFPDNCSQQNARLANQMGRMEGDKQINKIISSCSQPAPRPNPPPRNRCSPGNSDYDSGVQITKDLGISCSFVDFANLEIQTELAKRNANDCVRKGAFDEFDRVKRRCGDGPTPSPPEPSNCGRYTGGMPAMTAAKGIVTRMWERNGESCSYANNGFRRDAERAIREEFPDNCRQQNVRMANQMGRMEGDKQINKIISSCSQPAPRPTPEPTYPPTWPNRPSTGRITDRDIRNECGSIKNCNGCKKQCPRGDIRDACKDQHCSIEEMLEDEFEASLSE